MKTKQKNSNIWDIVQIALLVINITLLLIILAFPLLNKTNHTDFELYYFVIPFLITALFTLVLSFIKTSEIAKLSSSIIFMSMVGILLLYSYNRFNILLNYDEWVNRGAPSRFQEVPSSFYSNNDSNAYEISSLKPQELAKVSITAVEGRISDLIIADLQENGVKGDIESEIKIAKLESSALFDNSKVELYTVILEYAWLYSTYLVQDGEILAILSGVEVFIADLDADGIFEVYSNYSVGSGIVSDHIDGFNLKTNERYVLGSRMENNVTVSLKDSELVVRIENYGDSPDYKEEKLVLIKKDGKLVLSTK